MCNRSVCHEVPEGMRVVVTHKHPGNSSLEERKGAKYLTSAKLMRGKVVLSTGTSRCGKKDVPSRKRGREIALGRCLVKYHLLPF